MSLKYNDPTELYTICSDVIDSIRQTNAINGIIAESGNYRYTADNSLITSEYITITTNTETFEDIQIIEADETSFLIKTEYLGAVSYKTMAPYFIHEKEKRAAELLANKKSDRITEGQRYPTFLLERPYTDDRTNQMLGYTVDFSLHIIVNTESEYYSDDRIDSNFDPIIYPLYRAFLNAMPDNRWIKEKDPDKISHGKTDLMFISGNPIPDKVDGTTISFNGLEVLKGVNVCEPITPQVYTLDLSSDDNGTATSSEGGEGIYTNVPKGKQVAVNANANAGFKFFQWLINNTPVTINPYSFLMNQNKTVIAQFVESLIKQLTIAVSGTGTTNPIPGDYDIESGGSQLIEAIETDEDYIFEKFDQDGNITTSNPDTFTVIDNSLVVAYFVIKWLQWVFGNQVQKIANLTYFIDRTSNANNVQVKNIPCGLFNGTVYMLYDMTGRTIVSYESDGSAVPTKTSDARIDVTAGEAYMIELDNGEKCYFNERKLDKVYFTDGTFATLESVVLDDFRINSDNATSGIHLEGYSKDLVCTEAGTTAHLASPDSSNLGSEKVINGEFDTNLDNWVISNATWSNINGGSVKLLGSTAKIRQANVLTVGVPYIVEVEILPESETAQYNIINNITTIILQGKVGINRYFIVGEGATFGVGIQSPILASYLDNVSVKEATAISLLDIFKFKLNPTICDTYYLDSTDITAGSGYMVRTTPTAITLFKIDAGALTQLDTAVIAYVNYSEIEINFHIAGITVDVAGTEELTSSDTTYNTFKFIVLNNNVGDAITGIKKGGIPYEVEDFSDQTGDYEPVFRIGGVNEIPANVISNTGNRYDGIEKVGIETDATYDDIYAIENDANTEITKTAYKEMGYVSELKIEP